VFSIGSESVKENNSKQNVDTATSSLFPLIITNQHDLLSLCAHILNKVPVHVLVATCIPINNYLSTAKILQPVQAYKGPLPCHRKRHRYFWPEAEIERKTQNSIMLMPVLHI
jgi:hypothetical protein